MGKTRQNAPLRWIMGNKGVDAKAHGGIKGVDAKAHGGIRTRVLPIRSRSPIHSATRAPAHGGGRTRIVPLRKGARYPIAPRERSHGRTRTADLLVRNQTLSSPELHGRCTVGMGAMVA